MTQLHWVACSNKSRLQVMGSAEDDLKKFIEPMSSEERKELYTELSKPPTTSTPSDLQTRFASIPATQLRKILYDEAEIPVYFVLGHGQEVPIEYEERNVLPKGYTLITETECGKVTYLTHLRKLINASTHVDLSVFEKPTKQALKDATGLDYFIYREGDPIPSMRFSAFSVFPKLGYATLSGIHKLPIQPGMPRVPIEKIPELSDEIFTKSAIFPKQKDIKTFLQQKSYKEYPIIDLFTFMKVNGPGVYYFPICRQISPFFTPEFDTLIEVLTRFNPQLVKYISHVMSTVNEESAKASIKLVLRGRLDRNISDEEMEAIKAFLSSIEKEHGYIERTRAKSTQRQRQIAGLRKNGKNKTRRRRHHGVQTRKYHS